jgi:hypothetical protein
MNRPRHAVSAFAVMKKKIHKTSGSDPALEAGQVWQCKDGRVLVGLVGKTLVHFRFYRHEDKRPPVQLARQEELKLFLRRNRALLRPDLAGAPASQMGGKQLQFGRSMFHPVPDGTL